MLNEHLAQLWTNVHSIEHASIRLFESDAITSRESILIKNGFFMLFGLTLEKASAVLDESSYRQFGGRLLKQSTIILTDKRGFSSFLIMLDEVDDIIVSIISSVSSRFKADRLFSELHRCLLCWSPDLWRTLSPLLRHLLNGELNRDSVLFLRQWSTLLSKIHIDRNDLLADSHSEYLYSEFLSSSETSVQEAKSNEYRELVLNIRSVLEPVISSFKMESIVPKHGPGAVAQSGVRGKVEKYLNLTFDSRIEYLLRKGTGESMSIYSPFPLCDSDRTSRAIFVPKSWKKLRGISAEPSGLQFFQQAVLSGLLKAIDSSFLSSVIDLQNQDVSRSLALRGSFDGTLATIDLSAASDSITLRLVKDIFGNTDLCRWLLATRSTHTLLGQQRLKLSKFAPMGSACCFPVQCLIFAGIAFATAAMHKKRNYNVKSFRVYGDDIICPTSLAPDLMYNLTSLGFSVNSEKSYWEGDYRESCGMDAWNGEDVTPLKLKDFSFDFDGASPCSYEHHSRIVSYLNHLYNNGYHRVRSFLLEKFLRCDVSIGKQLVTVQHSLLFGDGSRGTCASCQPDNYHLPLVPLRGYQRSGYKLLGWKPRYRCSLMQENLADEVNYFERQLISRSIAESDFISYDLPYFKSLDQKAKPEVKQGLQMIPTFSVKDPWIPEE